MRLSQWKDGIEHGAKWIVALTMEELAKPLVRAALAWARGWLRQFWTAFLIRSRATC